ncbi:glycine cleavage system protein GcvH [Novosphingobium sp. ZN18A2]|uniref:glycine cleavage system protein GcvH n=1 Tax=Novosphingobium sp. ZN18A2 TaxID=3079861 RepID=UPI0030CCE6B7
MAVYFTKEHEWISVEGETARVGITDYAQGQLGDITFVELPEAGASVKQGDSCCVVDSVKAASDVYAPVSGSIVEGNGSLEEEPELVNTDAENAGYLWSMTLSDPAQLESLMDEAAYKEYVEGL